MKRNFLRNVLILSGGTALAQLIYMICTPFITRLYGPEAYGALSVFISIVLILAPISSLTYPNAIVLPSDEKESNDLYKLSIFCSIVFFFISFVVLFFFTDSIINIFDLDAISDFIFYIPVAVFFYTYQQVAFYRIIRNDSFSISAKSTVLQSVFVNGSQISIAYFAPIAKSLIFIYSISHLMYYFLLRFQARHLFKGDSSFDLAKFISLSKKYSDFPFYRAPQVFINTISQNFPLLVFSSIFGISSAAYYALAKTVMGIPVNLIGKALTDVFYPKINKSYLDGEDIFAKVKKSTIALSLIGLPFLLIVFCFGPDVFFLVFGAEWIMAGEYSRWLSIWFYSMLCTNICAAILPVIGEQKFHLNFTILKTVLRILSIYISYIFFESEVFVVASYSVISFLINLYFIIKVMSIVRTKRVEEKNV